MSGEIVVSVVMPVYNEEKYIDACMRSLFLQDYPKEQMEWIFVDGNSTDRTREILQEYERVYPALIRVLQNPARIVPISMNLGISHARGRYIVRLDAHAEYAADYISACVRCLVCTGAQNVGGVAQTKASGFVGGAIAKMLSSCFGVGNSVFRTGGESGFVDTVPFGAFRREVFSRYGGYDERLRRNQDNELNFRIRRHGGGVYLSTDIRFSYYCRDSVGGIARMARDNGTWNVITGKLCPGAMGLRHFIPLLFLLSLTALFLLGVAGTLVYRSALFFLPLAAELSVYVLADVFFSWKLAGGVRELCLLLALFPIFHLSYGWGSVRGLFRLCLKKYRKSAYRPPKI